MRLFGEARVTRGSIAWTNPLRLRISVFPQPAAETTHAAVEPGPVPAEYDEDGRLYVFRFARIAPTQCAIDRDRIFDYIKHHKLPDEADRALRRDLRNQVELYADLRELETHPDVEPLALNGDDPPLSITQHRKRHSRLRAQQA
jgi:plasmid stabilization system protein ParE